MKETEVTSIVETHEDGPVLRVQKARLSVTSGADHGLQVELQDHGAVVGASPDCDLVLTDPAISRRHFEIRPTDSGFRLRDLGSTNGTFVQGVRIEGGILTGNETITAGKTKLRISLLSGHEQFPLSTRDSFGPLEGGSVAMRRVFAVLDRASRTESTLLLEGESGTGKDLAASTVHRFSSRKEGPFVVVDCGAIQHGLIESELFGHLKGAYTGADRDRTGAFESAEKGTVFLDEIGELDPVYQPRLLRLLENREVKRLGDNRYRPVNVRLIAATSRDLVSDVKAGRFREDLYYRLSVLRMRMPPLRERLEDIGLLAQAFLNKLKPDLDHREVVTEQVVAMFMNHDWPGNVRELRNVIERLLLFPEHPETAIQTGGKKQKAQTLQQARTQFERNYLTALLQASSGDVAKAARIAGIHRHSFYRLMSKYGIDKS